MVKQKKSSFFAIILSLLLIAFLVMPTFAGVRECNLKRDNFLHSIVEEDDDSKNYENAYSLELQTARADNSFETISAYNPTQSVEITQVDYFGNEIQIAVERQKTTGGYTYFLADNLRNINVLNNHKDDKGNPLQAGELIKVSVAEGGDHNNIFVDLVAVTVFSNLVKVWDFYADEKNTGTALYGTNPDRPLNDIRGDAVSNFETEIVALVHYGESWENAAYFPNDNISLRKEVFGFGDGKSNTIFDVGVALDVVGHEYQHAVTSKINPLVYKDESGALNEAYSDVFGMLIQNYELSDDRFWRMGEEISSDIIGGCLRDIKYPERLNNPSHYDNRYTQNGNVSKFVHLNSCIITHALYNMYIRSVLLDFDAFTKELIGKLYFTALPLLPTTATFSEFRFYLTEAAAQIGLGDDDVSILKEIIDFGFDRVGVNAENITNPSDYIFVTYYDLNNKLLRSNKVLKLENSTPPMIAVSFTSGWHYYSFIGWKMQALENGNFEYRATYAKSFTRETSTVIFIFCVFGFGTATLFLTIGIIKTARKSI